MPQIAQIPDGLDPIVEFILRQARGAPALSHLEARAGLGIGTIRKWLYQPPVGPKLDVVRRALNVLGYDLAIVPLGRPEGTTPPA